MTRAETARRHRERQKVPRVWEKVDRVLVKLLAALDHAGQDQTSSAVVQIREQLDQLHA